MTRYTGKNGTAGVGDMNPGADVYIESVGEFSYGSHVVEISEVGLMVDGQVVQHQFPMRHKGRTVVTSNVQRKLLEKARRLAKATLSGSVRADYLGVVGVTDDFGTQIARFLVTRNAR